MQSNSANNKLSRMANAKYELQQGFATSRTRKEKHSTGARTGVFRGGNNQEGMGGLVWGFGNILHVTRSESGDERDRGDGWDKIVSRAGRICFF